MLKPVLVVAWIVCLALAIHDFWIMAGSFSVGAAAFGLFLLAIYSAPFAIVYKSMQPNHRFHLDVVPQAIFFVGVVSFSLYLPCMRYFPGYKPDALESLKYFFGPIFFEGAFCAALFVVNMLVESFKKKKTQKI